MSRFFSTSLDKLLCYTPGEQPQGKKLVKLNTNELPYPPSPLARQAAATETSGLNLYNDPSCHAVLETLAKFMGVGYDNVFVSNGSDEALAFAFQSLCPNGAAFADLTYGFYPVFAQLYGIETEIIPLRGNLSIAPEDYADTVRTVFIVNPNAPTGLALPRSDIETLLLHNPNRLVVVDEAYIAFGGESAVPLLSTYDNLLIIGTFSKAHGMAGARLGYAVSCQEIISDLTRVKFSFNPYSVNSMTLAAGTSALQDVVYYTQCLSKVIATRERAIATMREMGFFCTDSKANFVFVSHPDFDAQNLYIKLRERGILVRWFDIARARDYLRITIGTDDEMAALYDALLDIIK